LLIALHSVSQRKDWYKRELILNLIHTWDSEKEKLHVCTHCKKELVNTCPEMEPFDFPYFNISEPVTYMAQNPS
jgi:hypothetical protein